VKTIRGYLAPVGATLLIGVLAFGCGTAETEVAPASDSEPKSDTRSKSPRQPTSSESFDPAPNSQRPPVLVGDNRDPVAPDLKRLVQMFVKYAVGNSNTFAHWESVSMSLGGEPVVSIDDIAAALSQRKIWKICPADWDVYGAASCPVDLLGPITNAAANDASLAYSAEYGDVTCAPTRTGPLPPGRLVVLRPTQKWRTCASDFALVLAADDQGRLRHIDLTLSEP
jgi:hypothetical protein